jgi:SAM-dependent methyltransferase
LLSVSKDEPAAWLLANVDLIPTPGIVLDVASGSGRNARFLAARGWRVHAVDRDRDALAQVPKPFGPSLHQIAASATTPITVEHRDLELGGVSLGSRCYQAVIVFNYLHRPLFPAIIEALVPGGVLIYETFTVQQAARGRPRNPAFLLHPGELPTLVHPLRVLRSREGEIDGRFVASIVAMR